MLFQFLEKYRPEILDLTEQKTLKLAGDLNSSVELKKGLPHFFEQLIIFLKGSNAGATEKKILSGAATHGKELLRLNYTLSHVVHAYGAMCQAITEYAYRKKLNITPAEFNDLNLCLDLAIAAAVSEFQFQSIHAIEEREVQHLGILVHELRNALSSASIAHEMIKKGLVGTGGSTARVLEENLKRMRILIDRSLSDIRMRAEPEIFVEKFLLNTLIDQILLTAQSEADTKEQHLFNDSKEEIEMFTDRQLLLSAIANLVQNALKFTKLKGRISVVTTLSPKSAVIEVRDEGDGISASQMKSIFKPFTSSGFDQTGMGLGLTIVQRAVQLMNGKISVKSSSGVGSIFRIELPLKLKIIKHRMISVSGKDSVQPNALKKKRPKK